MASHRLQFLLAFLVFLLAICPNASATPDIPQGPHISSCSAIQTQGTTLVAKCTNFFGAQQDATLNDAPACVADHHSIENVSGFLRCVVWEAPNQGIVSTLGDFKDDHSETQHWRIDQPVVNIPGSFGYSMIQIKPGDILSISAGGCVQTGGSGATWKSYTNPLGDSADHLYSGTIAIPGVIGDLQRIGGVLAPKEWIVPRDLPPTVVPQLMLQVGYQDDDYGDNGYYAYDNGNYNQCANVGPAWIEVKIARDLTASNGPQYSPHSKPFDLTWDINDGVDANGLPLNADWAYQLDHRGEAPDFKLTCGSAFSTDDWPATGSNINVGILADNCTSQSPYTDLSTNDFDMFFTICRSSLLPGHLNWSIGTYQGHIFWGEYSGNWPDDGDYNFNFFAPNNAGMTTGENGIGLEFKGGETVDNFGNPWWQSVIGSRNASSIEPVINGHLAIVTGLIGQDAVHGGYAESHPVFAMAIELSETASGDSIDQQWVYFVRNSGNEGECSHMTHTWPGLGGNAYYVSFPWPSAHVTGVQFDNSQFWKDEDKAVNAGHGLYPGWSYIKFEFPDDSTMVDGVVTLHYKVKAEDQKKEEYSRPKIADVHEEDEANFDKIAASITDPTLRTQFLPDLTKAEPATKSEKAKRVVVKVDNSIKEHNPPRTAGRKGEMTRDRRADDPQKLAEAEATKPLVDKYRPVYKNPDTK